MKTTVVSAAVVALATSAASAQQAVQWRVEDGGNGHWYQFVPYGVLQTWNQAFGYATERGGHLATIRSAAEQAFAYGVTTNGSCEAAGTIWLGADQPAGSPPNTGWRWMTGEPWGYTNWSPGEPNDYAGWPEDCLIMLQPGGLWQDARKDGFAAPACTRAALIEWSADCNGDGTVDYGQILLGQLADENDNGVPDQCDQPSPDDCNGNGILDVLELQSERAFDENANGILDVCESATPAPVIRAIGVNRGGTCGWWTTSPIDGIWDLWVSRSSGSGPWVNGGEVAGKTIDLEMQLRPGLNNVYLRLDSNGCTDPLLGLGIWLLNTQHAQIAVSPGMPPLPYVDHLNSVVDQSGFMGNGASSHDVDGWHVRIVSLEWSVDGDIVDAESIRPSGRLDQLGVLQIDVLRLCPADVTRNGVVDGVDLAAILGAWGTNGQNQYDCDIDNDGVVSGTDLAFVLGGWGPCQ
jgi:hypothetical protein